MKVSKNIRIIALSLLSVLFFGAVRAQAATYYVATTGNDASACAQSQSTATPRRTLASGISCLAPGDKLYIRAGTYAEQLNISGLGKTGTVNQWLTIAGYPGEKVIIRPPAPMAGYGAVRLRGISSWVRVENLDIDGANLADYEGWIIAYGSHDIIIDNVRIYNQHFHGLYIEGDNITIQNSEIHDPRTDCVAGHRYYGIYFHNGNNGLIQSNNIHRNAGGGIQVYGESGSISNTTIRGNRIHDNNFCPTSPIGGIIVDQYRATTPLTNVSVYNNLVYNNGSLPGHAVGKTPGITVSTGGTGIKVWNNTVYGNDGQGIVVYGELLRNTLVQNNISYNNTLNNIQNSAPDTIIDHNLTTNPYFINAAGFDFRVPTSSPAIDAGIILGQVSMDFANNPRPEGFTHDIGAYELGTDSLDTTPPSAPKGVAIR